jgi:endonuclease/exonuclease/phosphatase family metal-dependent hydrolase
MSMKIMTLNLWCHLKENDPRPARTVAFLQKEDADIIGTQETHERWRALLAPLMDVYEIVGHGRNENKGGEGAPILYKKDKFELLDQDTKWLSPTPDVFSRYSEMQYYRVYTWALLKRKSDGKIFRFFNTHIDGRNQVEQIAQILEFFATHKDYPIIFTGDFNMLPGSVPQQMIVDAGMTDLGRVYMPKQVTTYDSWLFDYLYLQNDCFTSDHYNVHVMAREDMISDHFAVSANCEFKV